MEETMSNQEFRGDPSGVRPSDQNMMDQQGRASSMRAAASDAFSEASEMAKDAGATAKRAASDTASTVADHVKELLDRQIGSGADMAGLFASSARHAADDLSKQSPVLGGLVRTVADRFECYARDLQDQTFDQLARAASDFTRRQPALVFGVAALAGFFVFRAMKSAPSVKSPPIQPDQQSPVRDSYYAHQGR
jgi:hypothetical protein